MNAVPTASRRRFLLLSGASLLAACGPRGAMTLVPERPAGDGEILQMFVATTRRRIEVQPVFDRGRVDPPTFASFEVWVPPDRAPGSVTFPERQPPNLQTDFVTVSARQLAGEQAFVAGINADLAAHPEYEGRVMIFVHGYNTNFAEGLYRQAQILNDYGKRAAAVHFAWPSAASTQGYVFDRESALFSRDALERVIVLMAQSNATSINLIAHSMGCFLMMETLRVMARVGFDEVFAKTNAVLLLSPDIEIDVFRKQAPPVLARHVPIFVVVSTRDRALMISAIIRAERKTPRVGSIASPAELGDIDVTVIDLSKVEAGGGMGHFALARSPELIALLNNMRDQGIDVLDTKQQQGLIGSGVSLIQQGTDILLSPLAPVAP